MNIKHVAWLLRFTTPDTPPSKYLSSLRSTEEASALSWQNVTISLLDIMLILTLQFALLVLAGIS